MNKTTARARAITNGDKYYVSETPCKNGHKATRLVMNSTCRVCARETARKYRLAKGIKPRKLKVRSKGAIQITVKQEVVMNTEEETFNEMVKRIYKEEQRW